MIHNVAKYIDAENDYLYIRGKQEEQIKFVTSLLVKTDFDVEKIANIASVSVDFVMKIQEQQKNKS